MPLNTEIRRDGERRIVKGMGSYFVLSAMITACCKEARPDWVLAQNGASFADLGTETIDGVEYERYIDLSMAPIYYMDWQIPLFDDCSQIIKEHHQFIHQYREGEEPIIFELEPGDVCRAWRT